MEATAMLAALLAVVITASNADETPVSSACLFVGDYLYLGDSAITTNYATYLKENKFIINVDRQIAEAGSYKASAAFYGYDYEDFSERMQLAQEPLSESEFEENMQFQTPGYDKNVNDPLNITTPINNFVWNSVVEPDSCLVLFSGQSYSSDIQKIDNTAFSRVIGVSLNGAVLTGLADNITVVAVSNDFNSYDLEALVDVILSRNSSTRTTTSKATTLETTTSKSTTSEQTTEASYNQTTGPTGSTESLVTTATMEDSTATSPSGDFNSTSTGASTSTNSDETEQTVASTTVSTSGTSPASTEQSSSTSSAAVSQSTTMTSERTTSEATTKTDDFTTSTATVQQSTSSAVQSSSSSVYSTTTSPPGDVHSTSTSASPSTNSEEPEHTVTSTTVVTFGTSPATEPSTSTTAAPVTTSSATEQTTIAAVLFVIFYSLLQ